MIKSLNILLSVFLISSSFLLYAQDNTKQQKAFSSYFKAASKKLAAYNRNTEKQNKRYSKKLIKAENKIRIKLCKVNPELSDYLFSPSQIKRSPYYNPGLRGKTNKMVNSGPKVYFSYYDTLKNSLKYFSECYDSSTQASWGEDYNKAMNEIDKAEKNRATNQEMQNYLRQRKELLTNSLAKYPSLSDDLLAYKKNAFYYNTQTGEYNEYLGAGSKFENEALMYLKAEPEFNKYMKENSGLARFSNVPANWGKSIDGLQTNNQTQALVQESIKALGPDALNIIEKNMATMHASINKLKYNYPGITNAGDLPDFKPNPLKTKKIKDRLNYGIDCRFTRANSIIPSAGDIGLNISYKLTMRSNIGIGISYLLGMGRDIEHLRLSQEGVGMRSFLDYRVKGLLFLQGGFEKSFIHNFNSLEQLKIIEYWSTSALLGLKLKYRLAKNKSGTFTLMYDFLHEKHFPSAHALVYRAGWEF